MPSILDIINKRKQQAPAPVQAGEVAAQQRTLATGKAGAPASGPTMSSVQSQIAQQAGQAQQKALATQGLLGQQALGAQEQAQKAQQDLAQRQQAAGLQQQQANILAQTQMADQSRQAQEDMTIKEMATREELAGKQMSQGYADALANLAQQRGITEQEIFGEAKRVRAELGAAKYQSFLDQAAHVTALSDRKYTDELRRIGMERNLQDELDFRQEALRIGFGNDLEFLGQQFDLQRLLNADRREAERILSQIDINTALRMAEQASKESQYANILKGTVEITKAGVESGMFEGSSDSNLSRPENSSGVNDAYNYDTYGGLS